MPYTQCPVQGCGKWSHVLGKKSYTLPSPDTFALQLIPATDVTVNDHICQPCWKRYKNPDMPLDGRTRVVPPIPSPSPLDALLSAISPFSSPSSSTTSSSSLSSHSSSFFSSPTPARVFAFNLPLPPTTICPPLRRTHSSPTVLDVSPPPSTYSKRPRDVVASVMAGIDYERYRLQEVMRGGQPHGEGHLVRPPGDGVQQHLPDSREQGGGVSADDESDGAAAGVLR